MFLTFDGSNDPTDCDVITGSQTERMRSGSRCVKTIFSLSREDIRLWARYRNELDIR